MMVASTIMAVAIVGLLSAIGAATRNAARLREYDRAAQLARLRMNELLADDALSQGGTMNGAFDPSLTGGTDIEWEARLTTVEMPAARVSGQPCLQRIELQIWWMSGEQRKNFTLDAFRTHLLTQGDL
jgi:hypothetical protein